MLLQHFEEKLDLPAVTVDSADGGEVEVEQLVIEAKSPLLPGVVTSAEVP